MIRERGEQQEKRAWSQKSVIFTVVMIAVLLIVLAFAFVWWSTGNRKDQVEGDEFAPVQEKKKDSAVDTEFDFAGYIQKMAPGCDVLREQYADDYEKTRYELSDSEYLTEFEKVDSAGWHSWTTLLYTNTETNTCHPLIFTTYSERSGEITAQAGTSPAYSVLGSVSVQPGDRQIVVTSLSRARGGCGSRTIYSINDAGHPVLTQYRYKGKCDDDGDPPPPNEWPVEYSRD